MIKDLLPIGSIVLLKGGVRKLMIIGIKVTTPDQKDVIFDYMGVLYPEGFMGEVGNFLFNQSDINDVIFKGYNNPERETFLEFIEENWVDKEKEERKITLESE